jgi:hypothetical protein
MPLLSRRVFRLSGSIAICLAIAYGMQFPLPFLAPLFALILGAKPAPPPAGKGLLGLLAVLFLTLGVGLVLTPVLTHYPVPALLMIAIGIYLSTYLAVGKGKLMVGLLLTIGMTLITAAGTVSHALAVTVIQALALAVAVAIMSQWLLYPFFPEDCPAASSKDQSDQLPSLPSANWIAFRSTLIVMPAYILVLTNPAMYLAVIMKTVNLSQQSTILNARDAGRELLGSTLVGGLLAVLFWFALDLVTNLWMFSLWMLLFALYIASKLYRVTPTRFSRDFWQNAGITRLILLGPAVHLCMAGYRILGVVTCP